MKVNSENKNALKGQQILAQGFGVSAQSNGNALGLWTSREIVRAITFNREDFYIRTKGVFRIFRSIRAIPFRPKKIFALFIRLTRTAFLLHPLPRLRRELSRTATFRIVPTETLPWAELYWPFRPGLMYKE